MNLLTDNIKVHRSDIFKYYNIHSKKLFDYNRRFKSIGYFFNI